jgi:hypothetical protein
MHSDINQMEETLDEDADVGDNNVQELVRRALRSKAPHLTTTSGCSNEHASELPPPEPPPGDGYESE